MFSQRYYTVIEPIIQPPDPEMPSYRSLQFHEVRYEGEPRGEHLQDPSVVCYVEHLDEEGNVRSTSRRSHWQEAGPALLANGMPVDPGDVAGSPFSRPHANSDDTLMSTSSAAMSDAADTSPGHHGT